MSFRCLPEATNNSSNGKRYSSETKMLFFFFLGAADTAPNISELLIRYFKTCWMVPIQDEVAADCRQALVFLTLQQWHMMRVHHSQIAGWLMKIPGFRLHRFTIPGWLENPWRFDKPSPSPDQRVGDAWRRRVLHLGRFIDAPWSRRYAPRFWPVPAWCAFPPLQLGCTLG